MLDPVGGSDAQRAARAELRKGEYHRDDPGLVQRAINWVLRHLGSLFDASGTSHVTLVVLVLMLAAVIFAVVRAGPHQRKIRRNGDETDDPLRPLAARDHRRLAAEFAAAGRRAEAMREWLRAAVQTIEDRGVLLPRPGRTGAAAAREAGPLLPTASAGLRTAMAAFDEVWFGGRKPTDHDVTLARAAADAVTVARVDRDASGPSEYALPW
jgi:Domain of unknown function (DUF4129)